MMPIDKESPLTIDNLKEALSLLEISDGTTALDRRIIREHHQKLVKKYHPDNNKDNEEAAAEKFRPVQGAYQFLIENLDKLQPFLAQLLAQQKAASPPHSNPPSNPPSMKQTLITELELLKQTIDNAQKYGPQTNDAYEKLTKLIKLEQLMMKVQDLLPSLSEHLEIIGKQKSGWSEINESLEHGVGLNTGQPGITRKNFEGYINYYIITVDKNGGIIVLDKNNKYQPAPLRSACEFILEVDEALNLYYKQQATIAAGSTTSALAAAFSRLSLKKELASVLNKARDANLSPGMWLHVNDMFEIGISGHTEMPGIATASHLITFDKQNRVVVLDKNNRYEPVNDELQASILLKALYAISLNNLEQVLNPYDTKAAP